MGVKPSGSQYTEYNKDDFHKAVQDSLRALGTGPSKEFMQSVALGEGLSDNIGKSILNAIEQATASSVGLLMNVLSAPGKQLSEIFLTFMKTNNLITEETRVMLKGLLQTTGLLEPIITLIVILDQIKGFSNTIYSVTSQQFIKSLQKNTRFTIPGMLDVIRAGFVSSSSVVRINEIGAEQGLNDTDIALLWKSAYHLLDETAIRDIYFRRNRDAQFAYEKLSQLGMTPNTISNAMERWDLIPPVNDLITMAVREAFSESQSASLGLDSEFPSDFGSWALKQGLSTEWAKKYWRAHWQLPSPTQAFEMYQRNIIDYPMLSELLHALDYSPVWRDKLLAINFTPITRVDIRRLYSTGLMTPSDVAKAYQDAGYSPQNAALLMNWTVQTYREDTTKLTRAQIDKLYKQFYLSRDEMESLYAEMGYYAGEIASIVDLLTVERETEQRNVIVSGIKKLYIGRFISRSDCRQRLESASVNNDLRDALIEEWDIEILLNKRIPTKVDLDKWYVQRIIDPVVYAEGLAQLNYQAIYIPNYIRSLDIEIAEKEAKAKG